MTNEYPRGEASVVIAVLTYCRAHDLAELLPELLDQAATVSRSIEILVVDNDPHGGARDQVAAVAASNSFVPVRYVHEPIPGIAAGRKVV